MQWQPELFFSGITLADFSGSELVVEGVLTLVFCSVLYAVIGKNTIPALRFDSVDWAGRKRAELEAAWSPMLKGVARLATAAAPKGTEPLGLWTMSIVQAGEKDSADMLAKSHVAMDMKWVRGWKERGHRIRCLNTGRLIRMSTEFYLYTFDLGRFEGPKV